jgi:hypothetical protein
VLLIIKKNDLMPMVDVPHDCNKLQKSNELDRQNSIF